MADDEGFWSEVKRAAVETEVNSVRPGSRPSWFATGTSATSSHCAFAPTSRRSPVFGTQAVTTLTAVFGVFMAPIGWGWALLVWVYALAWFLSHREPGVVGSRSHRLATSTMAR